MDSVSESRLSQVHPELARRVRALAIELETSGIQIRITQGLRSWSDQDELYAQGRTTPGKIVTNAKGGQSAHNFGYAVDFVCINGMLPDWKSADSAWQKVLSSALNFGLAEGAMWRSFPDEPHLYLNELPANPDDEMRYVFQEQGLTALWESWGLPT